MLSGLVGLVLLPLSMGGNAAPLDVDGLWRTARHGAIIAIRDCGDASPCGTIAGIPQDVTRGETADRRNPDTVAGTRPLIGLPVLWGFEGEGALWRNGRLYNPEDGKTFRAALTLLDPDSLQVEGCFGPFCRSQVWHRHTDLAPPSNRALAE